MKIQDVISRFNTTPFLFVGSGITRRYFDLPNWEGLLRHFAERISSDSFVYSAYKSRAASGSHPEGIMPATASLIQIDYDAAWFSSPELRTLNEAGLEAVGNGASPFKMEVAAYIDRNSVVKSEYDEEIAKLKNLSKKNISGVITTNYDTFFERYFDGYRTYVGQDTLCLTNIQDIAEIYKIHGSTTDPQSIIINEEDYRIFNSKSKYLAAKLMTIFMEYPIIFLGYSITDSDIKGILGDIVECLPESKLDMLQERFVFVERKAVSDYEISSHTIDFNGKCLSMTKISLQDFGLLYDAMLIKKTAVSVKILRRFKEEIYSYVITSQPGPTMKVAALDDEGVDENSLAISIGLPDTGILGLTSILNSNSWYRDIVLGDLKPYNYSYDQRLKYGFTNAFKGVSGKMPVHKYLSLAEEEYPEVEIKAANSFCELQSNSIRKNHNKTDGYSSVTDVWEKENANPETACKLISYFNEAEIDVDELEYVLKELFKRNPNLFEKTKYGLATEVRRLIRYYDYLKWGKKRGQHVPGAQ